MYSIELLEKRHSVRSYSKEELSDKLKSKLSAEVTDINTHGIGLHFQLFFNEGRAFEGFKRSYGMFRNVNNYLAVVADSSFPDWEERAGYAAEQFCIYATSLGLGSCFVGGTFDAKAVPAQMRVDWNLRCLVAFGYAEEEKAGMIGKLAKKMVGAAKRPAPQEMYCGEDYAKDLERYPELETALRAIACAPSTLNKRPVRLRLDAQGEPELVLKAGAPAIDLGIARFNLEAVTSPF